MLKTWMAAIAGVLLAASALPVKAEGRAERERVENAGRVIQAIMDMPDSIPQNLLDHARCVVVMPTVLKAAFVFGGAYGRGVMVCRTGKDFEGGWGAPTMMALEGGSFGLQIGGEATDFVFLVMNDSGAHSLLKSKVKLGADASAAAGPVGRTTAAATDAFMRAEILTYSRARGVFAGISLEGSTLRPDGDANWNLYRKSYSPEEIVRGDKVAPPPAAKELLRQLKQQSPKLG